MHGPLCLSFELDVQLCLAWIHLSSVMSHGSTRNLRVSGVSAVIRLVHTTLDVFLAWMQRPASDIDRHDKDGNLLSELLYGKLDWFHDHFWKVPVPRACQFLSCLPEGTRAEFLKLVLELVLYAAGGFYRKISMQVLSSGPLVICWLCSVDRHDRTRT